MKLIPTKNEFLPPQSIEPNVCTVRTITAPDNTSISLCQVREARAYWKHGDTHTLSDEDMYASILSGLDPANITLILSIWHGPWSVMNIAFDSQAVHNITDNGSSTDLHLMLKDSPKLHYYMEVYQNKFLTAPGERESRYVAVMIRAEHSMRKFWQERSSNISANIQECLCQLQAKTKEAMRAIGTSKLLVTSDVGYYGSGTWHDHNERNVTDIQDMVKRGVERLYKGREGWSFEQWEQSFIETLGGVTDRGYVAALQRVLATSSKTACLVLMGGGRFQELSLENYLHHTRHQSYTRCVHLVCVERKYSELFSSMVKRAEY